VVAGLPDRSPGRPADTIDPGRCGRFEAGDHGSQGSAIPHGPVHPRTERSILLTKGRRVVRLQSKPIPSGGHLRRSRGDETHDPVHVVGHDHPCIEDDLVADRPRSDPLRRRDLAEQAKAHAGINDTSEEVLTMVRADRHKIRRMGAVVEPGMAGALATRASGIRHGAGASMGRVSTSKTRTVRDVQHARCVAREAGPIPVANPTPRRSYRRVRANPE